MSEEDVAVCTIGFIIVVVIVVSAIWLNGASNNQCVERGGQIIVRPFEPFDTCLLPAKVKP